jgi:hypothetical protein
MADNKEIAGKFKQSPRGAKKVPVALGRNKTGTNNDKRKTVEKSKDILRKWDPKAASSYLTNSKNGWAGAVTKGKCAKAVRLAINAGGIATPNNPVPAKDYKDYLLGLGFMPVAVNGYKPQAGDIAVFPGIPGNNYGHIEMYTGNGWQSDYVQPQKPRDGSYGKGFFANKDWVKHPFTIFRFGDLI